jgi:hypothetical protein
VRAASRLSSVVALRTRPPLCGGVDGRHPLHGVVNRMSAPFCRTVAVDLQVGEEFIHAVAGQLELVT